MEDSSLCNSTPNLLSARDRLLLDWSETAALAPAPKRTGRRPERTEIRQAWLDRRCVHGEESVAFSGSVELDSEGFIV